jgi:hypothetical protein
VGQGEDEASKHFSKHARFSWSFLLLVEVEVDFCEFDLVVGEAAGGGGRCTLHACSSL